MQKTEENCETLQLAAECNSMNKNQCLMKTSSSLEKCKKVKKFWNFTIGCRVAQHKQKSKFDQDNTNSSWKYAKKSEENLETLQLAAECYSINKNQSLIKIKPVVPEKNAKSEKILKLYNWLQSATAWTKIKVWSRSNQ